MTNLKQPEPHNCNCDEPHRDRRECVEYKRELAEANRRAAAASRGRSTS